MEALAKCSNEHIGVTRSRPSDKVLLTTFNQLFPCWSTKGVLKVCHTLKVAIPGDQPELSKCMMLLLINHKGKIAGHGLELMRITERLLIQK